MATYFYYFNSYQNAPSTGTSGAIATAVSSSSGVVQIASTGGTIDQYVVVGDVVKLYSNTDTSKFIYGVLTSFYANIAQPGEEPSYTLNISYDYRIYSDALSDMTNFLIYGKGVRATNQPGSEYISSKEDAVDAYKINVQIETAAYSEQYIRYKVTEKYDLVIDSQRRKLLGDFFEVARAANIFIIDDCASPNGVAYKLFFDGEAFESFNNKFRKEVKFRIVS